MGILEKLKGTPAAARLASDIVALEHELNAARDALRAAETEAVATAHDQAVYADAADRAANLSRRVSEQAARLDRLRAAHREAVSRERAAEIERAADELAHLNEARRATYDEADRELREAEAGFEAAKAAIERRRRQANEAVAAAKGRLSRLRDEADAERRGRAAGNMPRIESLIAELKALGDRRAALERGLRNANDTADAQQRLADLHAEREPTAATHSAIEHLERVLAVKAEDRERLPAEIATTASREASIVAELTELGADVDAIGRVYAGPDRVRLL